MSHPEFMPFGGHDCQTPVDQAKIHILPICYEHAVSYGTGTAEGPYHLLHASEQQECLDEETLLDWSSLGIHTHLPIRPSGNPETAVAEIEKTVSETMEKGFLLSIGGDHAITIGAVQAFQKRYPAMGVLQIDAHLDLRDTWNGSRFNHACVMRRVIEDMGLCAAQVGMRAICPEELAFLQSHNHSPLFAHQIDNRPDWISEILATLPDEVYLTLDVDGLDPSIMPGTGTPEPGGLAFRQVTALIAALGRTKKVVGADITELAKVPGTQVSEYTAAKLATKILVHCAANGDRGFKTR